MTELDQKTKKNKKNLRRIAIDPVSRVEGHGKVTLLVDDANVVQQARLHIVEFRGFEKFIQGRPYWELPLIVQRLCGICPVSHHLAAGKAIDQLVGVDNLSPAAEKLRRLMHFGQVLQSHALHFFHLASPDLLFGFDANLEQRNVVAVIEAHRELALKGIRLRKFGQQIIEAVSGKRIHGIAAVPGGMNQALNQTQVDTLHKDVTDILTWSEEAVSMMRDIHLEHKTAYRDFALSPSNYLSLVGNHGELEIYDGKLRLSDAKGNALMPDQTAESYHQFIDEQVKSWSYMKFPFIRSLGSTDGWYRVGPLARLNNCSFIPSPRAEARRIEFFREENRPAHSPLLYHWARMIEVLHCAEMIEVLLQDNELQSKDLQRNGTKREEGIGVIEAPRGTLIHHYRVSKEGLVEKANLIVSTTHNNTAMNLAVQKVANDYLSGSDFNEKLLNAVEVAIRAYDPCLSCATHALGKMPLIIELQKKDQIIGRLTRHSDGRVS